METPVLVMIMMVAMMVILIVFAFLLVMGGADSAPKDDGTVVIRVDKEHAQEVADIFKQLLCDRFEYDSSHERQRDQDIISDVFNTTPPPPGETPGRELFRKLADFKNLSQEEQLKTIGNLEYFGIPVDVSKLMGDGSADGDDDDSAFVPEDDEDEGVTHRSSLGEFDDRAGVSDGADGKAPQGGEESGAEEEEKEDEENEEENGGNDADTAEKEEGRKKTVAGGRKSRVSPVRTAESDRKKKDAKSSGRGGSRSALPKTEPQARHDHAPQAHSALDEDKEFGARGFDPIEDN